MLSKTANLRDLVRSLGILVVVVDQFKPSAAGYGEPPAEILTASCRMDGLTDAIGDSGFGED